MSDFDPDAFLASNAEAATPTPAPEATPVPGAASSFDPDQFLEQANSEQYEGLGHTLGAALEGAAKGTLGFIAPYIERHVLDIPKSDIRGRQEAHPIAHGAGEIAGLTAGAVTGTGEAAVLGKAGELASSAAGLGELAETAPLIHRVGSEAVKQAAEMAVLQGSDEVAKKIVNDPNSSAESAIANIGLAAALGGVGGAFITGAVNPLWNATAGPKVEGFFNGLKDYMHGGTKTLPADMQAAADTLGVDVGNEIRGANSSIQKADTYNHLKSLQNVDIREAEQKLHQNVSESVMSSTGKPVEEFQNYDTAAAGRQGMEKFKDEYRAKAEPITKEFEALTEPFKNAPVGDSHVAELSDKVVQLAQEKGYLGADVPQQKIVDAVLNRLPGLKDAADIKQLMTTIGNIASENPAAYSRAARDVKGLVMDTMQNVLGAAIKEGAPETFERYVAARQAYGALAKMSERMGSELSIGKFGGPETFLHALEAKRSPEEFFKKLSPENNAEILPLLQQHFPGTLEYVKDNEMKKIVAPAVKAAKGDHPINVKTIQDAIKTRMKGQQEYVNWALPPDLIKKAEAAETLKSAIPGIKDSGTGGWIEKNIKETPMTVMGFIAGLVSHNPLYGALLGHTAQLLRRDLPDGIRLGMLRYAGSSQPVKAEGLRAMAEFLHNTYKGENLLARSASNVLKRGAQVLTTSQMPDDADRKKLDKIVGDIQNNPEKMQQLLSGQTGYYLPEHHTALAQTSTQAIQYLQQLKPKAYQPSPLDRPIEPSEAEMSRYHRALDIANQPAIVMQHVKEGTLQQSDLADLNAMYPGIYQTLSQNLTKSMIGAHSDEEPIPFKTRVGISLFLGQPLDSSMAPTSIMAAQPKPQAAPQQLGGNTPKSMTSLGKQSKMYMTPNQQAEANRSSKS